MYYNVARSYQNRRRAGGTLKHIKKMFAKHTGIDKSRRVMLDAERYFKFNANQIDKFIARYISLADYEETLIYNNNPCDHHVFMHNINRCGYDNIYLKIMEIINKKGILTKVKIVSFHPPEDEIEIKEKKDNV